uniref:G protein-coupled receptor n=1 Tax=Pristionchus pacificus TaxID=54126 RepID=A0A8R1YZY3_PRIPA
MMALPRWIHETVLYNFLLLPNCSVHPSSRNLGNYRVLLCAFAIADITISLLHAVMIPVFVQAEFGFVIFGFNTLYLSEWIGYFLNGSYCVLYFEPFILLTFHFMYRLHSVVRNDSMDCSFTTRLAVGIVMNAALSFMIVTDIWLIYPEIPENFFANVLMREYGIDLNSHPPSNVIPVHYIHAPDYGSGPNWHSIFSMLSCGALALATIFFNATCGVLITKAVKQKTISVTFRRLQVQLLRALVIQFSIPVAFCVIPFFIIVGLPATNIVYRHTGNVMGFIVSAFPVIDPISVILAYSRFRIVVTAKCRKP